MDEYLPGAIKSIELQKSWPFTLPKECFMTYAAQDWVLKKLPDYSLNSHPKILLSDKFISGKWSKYNKINNYMRFS